MKSIFAFLLTAVILGFSSAGASAQTISSGWLSSQQYQQFYNSQVANSALVPVNVQATVLEGQLRFNGTFAPPQVGGRRIAFATHHGLNDQQFNSLNQSYTSQGYSLTHHQRYAQFGYIANQGIWTR